MTQNKSESLFESIGFSNALVVGGLTGVIFFAGAIKFIGGIFIMAGVIHYIFIKRNMHFIEEYFAKQTASASAYIQGFFIVAWMLYGLALFMGFIVTFVNNPIVGSIIMIMPIAIDSLVAFWVKHLKKIEAEQQQQQRQQQEHKLFEMRNNREALDAEVRLFYENKKNVQTFTSAKIPSADGRKGDFSVSRSIISMTQMEVEVLKFLELFRIYELFPKDIGFEYGSIQASILYNNGNCKIVSDTWGNDFGFIKQTMERWNGATSEVGVSKFLALFSNIAKEHPTHPLVLEFQSKILGGSKWLADTDIASSPFTTSSSASAVFIGETESGQRFWYANEGSLISVAPPGSGKTQCHVLPNLVTYRGPVIVLDLKGSCYDKTSAWRKANVGPVYKFNPLNPADSARYNPLALIATNPETLWEDCRLMADLLIVPKNAQDPTWETRARDVVCGIIAWLVLHNPPEQRSMAKIVDVVSKVGWKGFVEDAKYSTEISALSRLGNALEAMPDKQLEGVLDAARSHLAVWEGPRVEKVTASCDWTPDVLRDGSHSTIYICIPPHEIESYAPLLRVLFAQHLRHLLKQLPPPGQSTILFMLDELPRLGPMKPVEEAVEVGREYGIRLWLFAQSLGQLEKTYANAEGMIGSCAVRIFMNPSSHDGTAKRVSEELGYRESLIDGSRQLMVEPTDLVGPEYADYQLVFARDTRPAKLKKVFAYKDEEFAPRLGG